MSKYIIWEAPFFIDDSDLKNIFKTKKILITGKLVAPDYQTF